MTNLKWNRPSLRHRGQPILRDTPKKKKRVMNKHWSFMPFGQYKDVTYEKLPRSYLEWAAANIKETEVRMLLTAELKRRRRNNLV